jgi:hypothetical protein
MRPSLLRCIFAIVIGLSCTAATAAEPLPKAKWTVMCYAAADNDLEAPMMEDLKQMLAAGSTQAVNIVTLVKRSPKSEPAGQYTDASVANLPDWSSAKLLYVEKGKLREIDDWGSADTGNPATLKKFILQVARAYPAERFALFLNDHGMSWPGMCSDETANESFLTTSKIRAVLAETARATDKLELIGMDACLMANLEVGSALAPFGKFMVASEELEPLDGWNYTPMFEALAAKPEMSGAEFGRVIADTYKQSFDSHAEKSTRREGFGITLSVISLDAIPALETAVKGMAVQCSAALNTGNAAWIKVAEARAAAEQYGSSADPKGESPCVHDLGHLAALLKKVGSRELTTAVESVETALRACVIHSVKGKARPNANGLSIFFPQDMKTLAEEQPLKYLDLPFGAATEWQPFLSRYCTLADADATRPELSEPLVSAKKVVGEASVTVESNVKGDDIEEAYFVLAIVDGKDHIIIGQVNAEADENGKLSETWDGKWFTLEDKEKKLVCPITKFEEVDDEENSYFAEVPAQVKIGGKGEWKDVTLYFLIDYDKDEITGEFVYAFREGKHGPRQVEFEEGDLIRPIYVHVDAEGNQSYVAADDPEDIIKIEDIDDLMVREEKVDAGNYVVGFAVTDLAGNTDATFTAVEVE